MSFYPHCFLHPPVPSSYSQCNAVMWSNEIAVKKSNDILIPQKIDIWLDWYQIHITGWKKRERQLLYSKPKKNWLIVDRDKAINLDFGLWSWDFFYGLLSSFPIEHKNFQYMWKNSWKNKVKHGYPPQFRIWGFNSVLPRSCCSLADKTGFPFKWDWHTNKKLEYQAEFIYQSFHCYTVSGRITGSPQIKKIIWFFRGVVAMFDLIFLGHFCIKIVSFFAHPTFVFILFLVPSIAH